MKSPLLAAQPNSQNEVKSVPSLAEFGRNSPDIAKIWPISPKRWPTSEQIWLVSANIGQTPAETAHRLGRARAKLGSDRAEFGRIDRVHDDVAQDLATQLATLSNMSTRKREVQMKTGGGHFEPDACRPASRATPRRTVLPDDISSPRLKLAKDLQAKSAPISHHPLQWADVGRVCSASKVGCALTPAHSPNGGGGDAILGQMPRKCSDLLSFHIGLDAARIGSFASSYRSWFRGAGSLAPQAEIAEEWLLVSRGGALQIQWRRLLPGGAARCAVAVRPFAEETRWGTTTCRRCRRVPSAGAARGSGSGPTDRPADRPSDGPPDRVRPTGRRCN